ncbi:hypothetical protein Patl1_24189 [Pistacia atlantica]|uniref:Uncharacterized protein n=1 Tax=Pistacia atlantica TaxID=434234 RepID=A0ACC0ZXU1_9ROSI|nr:hypothetical protein Patl1_24189 [Pistacia atlantica]
MSTLIHHAINGGVTFLDTSDVYGPHTNEILLGKALKGGMRERVEMATKFGARFEDDKLEIHGIPAYALTCAVRERVELATKFGARFEDGKLEIHGDPAYVRASCEGSLNRLDVDCIDLYYIHHIDTQVPIEVTMGELKKLVEGGKIKYIGLSEACASTIGRAHVVHSITAMQLEWSLWARDVEEEIVPTCRKLGIGIVAYSPLRRVFLSSGPKLLENISKDDFRQVCKQQFNS